MKTKKTQNTIKTQIDYFTTDSRTHQFSVTHLLTLLSMQIV
jgi:hypothetical protein